MEYEKLIRERFSTRKFKDDMVSDELITKMLLQQQKIINHKKYM